MAQLRPDAVRPGRVPEPRADVPSDPSVVSLPRFGDLTPRERQCLRLVAEFKTSKEIERELGIAKSTVDGYLAEAVRKLGARDRRHAALLLAAHEGAGRERTPPQAESGGDPARVAAAPAAAPDPAVQGRSGDWRAALPLRRRDARHNPLPPQQRLLWVALLALAMMIGFGMLATGLAALTDVVLTVVRLVWR
jgi:DNA-binding CsgD family transcriptional regulator